MRAKSGAEKGVQLGRFRPVLRLSALWSTENLDVVEEHFFVLAHIRRRQKSDLSSVGNIETDVMTR